MSLNKMQHKINTYFLLLISVFAAIGFLTGCEPAPEITFDNQQNQEVYVYVASVRDDGSIDGFVMQASVSERSSKIIPVTFLGDDWVNRIQIRDIHGTILMTFDYKMGDLEKQDWKITILP